MVLRKKGGYFDWERGRNSAPRDGQKIPRILLIICAVLPVCLLLTRCLVMGHNSLTYLFTFKTRSLVFKII